MVVVNGIRGSGLGAGSLELGAGTDEDETRVKALVQRWFNYVCSSEVLMKDDEMILFVERANFDQPNLRVARDESRLDAHASPKSHVQLVVACLSSVTKVTLPSHHDRSPFSAPRPAT